MGKGGTEHALPQRASQTSEEPGPPSLSLPGSTRCPLPPPPTHTHTTTRQCLPEHTLNPKPLTSRRDDDARRPSAREEDRASRLKRRSDQRPRGNKELTDRSGLCRATPSCHNPCALFAHLGARQGPLPGACLGTCPRACQGPAWGHAQGPARGLPGSRGSAAATATGKRRAQRQTQRLAAAASGQRPRMVAPGPAIPSRRRRGSRRPASPSRRRRESSRCLTG